MANISFRAKTVKIHRTDGSVERFIKPPKIKRHHCDMTAFRSHRELGSWANSEFFESSVQGLLKEKYGERFSADTPPAGVTVSGSGLFVTVIASV